MPTFSPLAALRKKFSDAGQLLGLVEQDGDPSPVVVQDPVTLGLYANGSLVSGGAGKLDYFPIAAFFPGWSTSKTAGGPFPNAPWSVIPDNRVPLIGKFDDAAQANCDYQLELMRDYGIKAVCVEVYFQNGTIDPVYDYWLPLYKASAVVNKPKLMLMWVNNTNQGIYSFANIGTVWDKLIPHFRDQNYLRIDGKPAFSMFTVDTFQSIVGSSANVISAINLLRSKTASEFGGVFNVGFINNSANFWQGTVSTQHGTSWDAISAYTVFFKYQVGQDTNQRYSPAQSTYAGRFAPAIYGLDAPGLSGTDSGGAFNQTGTTFSSWFGNAGYPRPAVYTQGALTSNGWAGTSVPEIWAPVQTGWAPKPWDGSSTDDAIPTDAEFLSHLLDARAAVDAYRESKCKHGIVFITAWNEFGEGQFAMPTKGQGYSRLEAIRSVFGSRTQR